MYKTKLPETDNKEMAEIDCQHQDELIKIEGRTPLHGSVSVQGSKNAALPILAACLMIPGRCTIRNCHRCELHASVTGMCRLCGEATRKCSYD